MAGNRVELDAVYPTAMSRFLSTARLGMKRLTPSFPLSKVLCCRGPEVTIVPPVTSTWYQRMAEFVVVVAPTVCASQSDSVPPRLVYWFCIITRSRSVSRLFPSFAATVAGAAAQVESVTFEGPVKVEFAALTQST